MAAKKGNQYAKGSTTNGRPRIFETPEQWRNAVDEYFAWCDSNPWLKNEALKSGIDAGRIIQIPTQRPYLIEGLCNYLEISVETFKNYESNELYKDFFVVSAYARNRIFKQNLEGGYVGAFDSGLVARKLGIADKQEMKAQVSGDAVTLHFDGAMLQASNVQVVEPESVV